ncbi:putative proteasome regulatory particle subunit [Sporormia fimetaria CBS 119925]|uniref:Putative proteasome regulatory particle subunit n=1 Tax=Sporormia fimetaria CBS 119925 TaxID=1340428 RepID=A0A6A6V7G6_9PLEO|nr:putative proteasome regulatory particle subunit [Sporormia fimetaria CBS 119925]
MDETYKTKYALHEAIREGQTSKALALLSTNPNLSTLSDPDSRLPIHWAVSFDRAAVIETLVQQRNFDADAVDGSNWTPLMMACSRPEPSLQTIHLLLSKSADPNCQTTGGQTAMHFAASKAHLDVARALLAAKGSARIRDKRGQLPVHRAAAVGSVPMIKLLLGEGKSPVNAADSDGWTPLHHAVSEGHGDAALVLLLAGAEFEKEDKEGKRALELAPDAKTRRFIVQAAEREGIDLE